MKVLVDECCPRAIAERLRSGGHDVRYAAEQDSAARDIELLAIANAEDRIIVTEDHDFADLVVRDLNPAPGLIILFLPQLTPDRRAERLMDILATDAFDAKGQLIVIEPSRVRLRKLP